MEREKTRLNLWRKVRFQIRVQHKLVDFWADGDLCQPSGRLTVYINTNIKALIVWTLTGNGWLRREISQTTVLYLWWRGRGGTGRLIQNIPQKTSLNI